jgi:putative toxin-antitoxin system antitoxin component (TIGR02293 family)
MSDGSKPRDPVPKDERAEGPVREVGAHGEGRERDDRATLTTRSLGEGLALAREVRQGISTESVQELLDLGVVARDEVYRLVIPQRTLSHRRSRGEPLSPEESNRLARVTDIVLATVRLFESPEVAARWLRRPNRALGGERPLDLLTSDAGARVVEQVLGRIEHGVYS